MKTAGSGAQKLKREFTFGSALALAFAFISPIVALYTIFGLGLQAGGGAFWWGFLVVLAGQGLVACVFAELVSIWPLEGSVYQWSRHMLGNAFGWFAGWAYIWTLIIAVSAVCYGGAGFLAPILGIDSPSNGTLVLISLGILGFATVVNTVGRRFMKIMVGLSITAEVIGSLVLGTILLLFYRENSLGILFDTFGTGSGGTYITTGFIAALAFIGWSFVGFESAGAIAEEVQSPRKTVPKAIITSLFCVAAVVMYSALGLLLAIPDVGAVLSGESADPITDTLTYHLGTGITKPLFSLFVIGFTAAVIALQAGASRVIFGFGRDRALPFPTFLSRLSEKDALPINAIVITAVASGLLFLISGSNIYVTFINFTTGGFYIAFFFPVLAALILRLKGRWSEGQWNLGRWAFAVNAIAVCWLIFEIINIAWPRATEMPWYQNWAVVLMAAILAVIGGLIYSTLSSRMVRYHPEDMERAASVTDDDSISEPEAEAEAMVRV